jgi:hypothetical protein
MNEPSSTVDVSHFWTFNWYYICAVTLSFIGICLAILNYRKKNKEKGNEPVPLTNSNTATSTVTVNVNGNHERKAPEGSPIPPVNQTQKREDKIGVMKAKVNILFIDDDKNFKIVKILKGAGWKNTRSVIDVNGIDIPIIRTAEILFVDINGIGITLGCEHGGLDIAQMIKERYPEKKVIIYSANKTTNAFHPAWDIVDFKLEKNALPNQFQGLVETYSLELFESLK